MKDEINVAELLKNCPKGMELDCTMFDDVKFSHIQDDEAYPIVVTISDTDKEVLTAYGAWNDKPNAKCVVFPKGKTTWGGFVPPCQFNDGDIVATDSGRWVGIIKNKYNFEYYTVHCAIDYTFNDIFYRCGEYCFSRLATEEEKSKLFDAIKANGYKWNAETKTLEKLPKFKVGDRIRQKGKHSTYTISDIKDSHYFCGNCLICDTCDTDWELVTDKFDITTLVPFESRVLVRNSDSGFWQPTFWGIYESEKTNEHQYRNYLTTKGFFRHCIPYNDDTKHLLGTTDDCDEYFKTWE